MTIFWKSWILICSPHSQGRVLSVGGLRAKYLLSGYQIFIMNGSFGFKLSESFNIVLLSIQINKVILQFCVEVWVVSLYQKYSLAYLDCFICTKRVLAWYRDHSYYVAAFLILFILVCNMIMFKYWSVKSKSMSQASLKRIPRTITIQGISPITAAENSL